MGAVKIALKSKEWTTFVSGCVRSDGEIVCNSWLSIIKYAARNNVKSAHVSIFV